jgi:Na+/glutamate symporter
MIFKLDRQSYLFGIVFGICIGIGIGYMLSSAQVLQQIGRSNDSEVVVAIAALKKLDKNDVASASQLLRRVIATNYLDHTKKMNSLFLGRAYRNSELVERVEKAANELPSLEQVIKEERIRGVRSAK